MDALAIFISVIAVVTGLASLWFTHQQWQKIKRKIGMLSVASEAIEILPAWYTERMMSDQWLFGLLTADGSTIAFRKIAAISDDGKWMDIELLTEDELPTNNDTKFITAVAGDRRSASIQISQVVMAYEIITS
jgi:hypothetical protein